MGTPHWNRIEFDLWVRDLISVSVNNFGEGPIILELEGGYHDPDLSEWMTPQQARELAAKLIEAADATDKAGPFVDQQLGPLDT
jgi:hypothetical protein